MSCRTNHRAWIALAVLASLPASARAQPQGEPPQSPAPALTPPQVIEAVDPTYPPEEVGSGRTPVVVLHVTIDAEGHVQEVHVDDTAGEAFDREALAAIQRWRFEPARRDGQPIAARVRVELRFAVPELSLPGDEVEPVESEEAPSESAPEAVSAETSEPAAAPIAETTEAPSEPALGVEARLAREESEPPRTSSEHVVDRALIDSAPRREAADIMNSVPGMFAARGEGDAVAHRIMLRGFDAAHGQDIELTVEGVPINLPSHVHGQGYADVSFALPEVVRALRVTEGVYDPSQGDFAVAGSVDFRLGVTERDRGVTSRTTYGSFDTFRQLLLFAPRGMDEQTFGAAAYRRTDGYGQGRASESGDAIVSIGFGDREWHGRVLGIAHGARAALAGVLRAADIESGRVGFYDRYDDPVAQAQSALAVRFMLAASLEHRGDAGSRTQATLWTSYDDFRLEESFTGYTQRSEVMPEWVGRGDLIEQRNETISFGLRALHRTETAHLFDWLHGTIELGLATRGDVIEQRQNLLAPPQNETWDRRADASITGADVGAWADLDLRITDYVHVRGGVRGDALYYDVDDRLGNFIPAFRRDAYIVGFRRSAFGIAAGPRASIEVRPIRPLSLMVAYGEGYRSPQARLLQDGESAPFTKVRSGDLGFRLDAGDARELSIVGTAFYTHLSDDVIFEPEEGRLSSIGPSTRIGGVLTARTEPWPWLFAQVSVTYVHATIDEPPPATAEDPTPALQPGSLLPFVPPWVVRADVGAHGALFELDGHSVEGRLGVGFSFLSPRPLPFGQFASPVALLDATASVRWRWLSIGVDAFNILDTQWSSTELYFVSNWNPSAPPSRLPARHISAGAPLTILATLGVTL